VRKPGGTMSLAEYRGKVVGLAFILTDCPHCQKFSKTMEEVYQESGADGFQPLVVAINDGASRLVRDFSRMQGVTFPVGWTDQQAPIPFLQHPSAMPMYMPQFVLIDRQGVIRYQHGGSDVFFTEQDQKANLQKELRVLLAEK
jgi:peroxiredoxin